MTWHLATSRARCHVFDQARKRLRRVGNGTSWLRLAQSVGLGSSCPLASGSTRDRPPNLVCLYEPTRDDAEKFVGRGGIGCCSWIVWAT